MLINLLSLFYCKQCSYKISIFVLNLLKLFCQNGQRSSQPVCNMHSSVTFECIMLVSLVSRNSEKFPSHFQQAQGDWCCMKDVFRILAPLIVDCQKKTKKKLATYFASKRNRDPLVKILLNWVTGRIFIEHRWDQVKQSNHHTKSLHCMSLQKHGWNFTFL